MVNSKLLHYLKQLSRKDLLQFRDFVHSPYFNKHQKTKALLDYLLRVGWEREKKLQKENIFSALFKGEKYDEQQVSNLMTYLLRLLRRFLEQEYFEGQLDSRKIALLEGSRDKGLQKLFELTSRQIEKEIVQNDFPDGEDYYYRSQYYELMDLHEVEYGNWTDNLALEKSVEYLDKFYIIEKIKRATQIQARKTMTGNPIQLNLMKELMKLIQQKNFSDPIMLLYQATYQLLADETEKSFFQLKALLEKDAMNIPDKDGKNLYKHALNFCVRQVNLGKDAFKKESFDLYKEMLHTGLIYYNDEILQWDYSNIVTFGCQLKEYDWTDKFIFEQKEYLPKHIRDNAFTYNLAVFYLHTQKYDHAARLLNNVEFTDLNYQILTRILLLKIYFNSRDWQALEYHLDSFRIYILRHKVINENRKPAYLNLIRFSKKMAELYEEKNYMRKKELKEKLEQLMEKVEQHPKVLNKSWLLEVGEALA